MNAAPFVFQARTEPYEGAAFSPAFKLLACALLLGASGWLLHLWQQGLLGHGTRSALAWFAAALALMLATGVAILRSRTTLGATTLQQSWLWRKEVEIKDLAYCRLLRVRGLDWLIAPRLYTRTLLGKFAVFYAADAQVLAELERLSRELAGFRKRT